MGCLVAALVLVATVIAGVLLYVFGLELIGIVVALASIPIALAAWMAFQDRRI